MLFFGKHPLQVRNSFPPFYFLPNFALPKDFSDKIFIVICFSYQDSELICFIDPNIFNFFFKIINHSFLVGSDVNSMW